MDFFNLLRNSRIPAICLRSAGLVSLLGFVGILIPLNRPARESRAEAFFSIPSAADPLSPATLNKTALNFQLVKTKDGVNTHSIRLESGDAGKLLESSKLGLLLVSNWTAGKVLSAKMVFTEKGTDKVAAVFVVKKGAPLLENRKLEFTRKTIPANGSFSPAQDVEVKIVSRGCPNLAIIAQFSPDEPVSNYLWAPSVSPKGVAGVASACGWYEPNIKGPPHSVAHLLSHAWGFGVQGGRGINACIIIAAFFWLAGVLALLRVFAFGANWGGEIPVAVGGALLFLSIGIVYSILIPPFQAPDEPDHFLTFANLNNNAALGSDSLELANSSHFERIKFRTDERLSTADITKPIEGGWAYHVVASDPNRSPLAKAVWSFCGKFLNTEHSGAALLGLRICNVVFVALCLAGSLILFAWSLWPEKITPFLSLPAIFTPGICFFAMALSNYSFLVGGYLVQAVALGIMWAQPANPNGVRRIQSAAGLLAGSGLALAAGAADNGVFSSIFWAVLIPLYWFIRGVHADDIRSEWKNGLLFVSGFLSGLLVVWLAVAFAISDFHLLPPKLTSFFDALIAGSFLKHLGAQTVLVTGFLFSIICASSLALSAGWFMRRFASAPVLRYFASGLLLLGVLFVCVMKYAAIPVPQSPAVLHSFANDLFSFLNGFLPGKPDWLVVSSFWGEFGWMDTPLPQWLVSFLRYGVSLGLLALLVLSFRKNGYSVGNGFLAASLLAVLAFISFIAVGYYFINITVSGRYLIGPYLLLLVPAYEGYRRLSNRIITGPGGKMIVNSGVCLLCMLIQYTAWLRIIYRYF